MLLKITNQDNLKTLGSQEFFDTIIINYKTLCDKKNHIFLNNKDCEGIILQDTNTQKDIEGLLAYLKYKNPPIIEIELLNYNYISNDMLNILGTRYKEQIPILRRLIMLRKLNKQELNKIIPKIKWCEVKS